MQLPNLHPHGSAVVLFPGLEQRSRMTHSLENYHHDLSYSSLHQRHLQNHQGAEFQPEQSPGLFLQCEGQPHLQI